MRKDAIHETYKLEDIWRQPINGENFEFSYKKLKTH